MLSAFPVAREYPHEMDARDIASDPADGMLLRRFVETGDEKAFARLVERHGGLVLGVACRSTWPEAADDGE